jgi:DNA replication and repair protein RecF
MYVRSLEVRDFRNYQRLEVEFAPGMVVIHGPNGVGKTNLLESICLAASGESPRAREIQETIRCGREYAFVRAELRGGGRELRLEVGLARSGQSQIKINGVVKRRVDLAGLAPVVYFSADDLGVIKGDAAARRQLLDRELSAVSRSYYHHLLRYRRSLEQRNRLLKELRAGRGRPDALGAWDRALARYGASLVLERTLFVSALAPQAARAHALLVGGTEEFVIRYRPSVACFRGQEPTAAREDRARMVGNMANRLEAVMREQREMDISRGATGSGPHRDDLELLLRGAPVRAFGSQGEQRACAVAIRLGLAALLGGLAGGSPVLLLDDVLSELDARYRAGVFRACAQAEQVVITCCDLADIPDGTRSAALVFEVRDGWLVGTGP